MVFGKDLWEMKEQLKAALVSIGMGDVQAVAPVVEQLKALPRTADGLFDTGAVDEKLFRAARLVYPVYAAYETECNKKEGYPDLIAQMRSLDKRFDEVDCFFATACYLDALIHTIENVSPQLYEYYSELVDMFKARVKETIAKYYNGECFAPKAGAYKGLQDVNAEPACSDSKESGEATWADKMIRDAIRLAGEKYVLLAEKYVEYV